MNKEKVLNKFKKHLKENENIYSLIKCKFCYTKLLGVEIAKNAYIGFSNNRIIICILEAIGENFKFYEYSNLTNFKIDKNKEIFEIRIKLEDNKELAFVNIKEVDDMEFLMEVSKIINS